MSVFVDSSALVKLYADEPGHLVIRDLDQMIVSSLVRVEVPAALWRKSRMGELSPGAAATLTAEFEVDYQGEAGALPRFSSIAVVSGILDHAAALVATHRLRAYDAMQLASACAARRADPGCSRFACADAGLRRAAAAEGFDLVP